MTDTLLKSALKTEAKRKEVDKNKKAWENKTATLHETERVQRQKDAVAAEALEQHGVNLQPPPESKLKKGQQVTSLPTPS